MFMIITSMFIVSIAPVSTILILEGTFSEFWRIYQGINLLLYYGYITLTWLTILSIHLYMRSLMLRFGMRQKLCFKNVLKDCKFFYYSLTSSFFCWFHIVKQNGVNMCIYNEITQVELYSINDSINFLQNTYNDTKKCL